MADCKAHSTPCEMDIKKTSDELDLIISYLPTPPLRQDMTQGQFLSGV